MISRSLLSVAAPYCPCIRTLNISTAHNRFNTQLSISLHIDKVNGGVLKRYWFEGMDEGGEDKHTRTSQNRIRSSSHRTRRRYLLQRKIRKR